MNWDTEESETSYTLPKCWQGVQVMLP